jgi:hypothetical protein
MYALMITYARAGDRSIDQEDITMENEEHTQDYAVEENNRMRKARKRRAAFCLKQ